jgi:uncharacterized surface protein with fasciclin (FAS1) repeats
MFSWKFVLCAALLATIATAQKSPSPSPPADIAIDDGATVGGDYNSMAPAGDYNYAPGDYNDYAAGAPGAGDYSEDPTYAGDYTAAAPVGDYSVDYAPAPGPGAAGPAVVKPTSIPSAAPATAPAPAPTNGKMTIGALVSSVCPDIANVIAGPNFSTLAGLIKDPVVANTEITLPKGAVVLVAPTNAAFTSYLAAVGPTVAANKTVVAQILANHIATAASSANSTATALSGETLSFWTEMGGVGGNDSPVPTGIAALTASNKGGLVTDADASEMAKISASVPCTAQNQYAFAVDSVLAPKAYEIMAPAAAPMAAAPGPAPSSGFKASAFAAVGAVAFLMM